MVDVRKDIDVKKTPTPTLKDAVVKISNLLSKKPTALNIKEVPVKGGFPPYYVEYHWSENGVKSKRIRKEIKKILLDLYQHGGAFNYQQLADALQIDVLVIRALLDNWMQSKYPHLCI